MLRNTANQPMIHQSNGLSNSTRGMGVNISNSYQNNFNQNINSEAQSKFKVNFHEQSRHSNTDSDISDEDYGDIDENIVKKIEKPGVFVP